MSDNKNKKRVYSKPIVEEPKEELIEEQIEVTEAKPIDPEVFETKLFVEEEPEEIKIEAHVEGEKIVEVLETNHNVDAVEEFRKMVQTELEKPLTDEELTKESPAPEPEKTTEEFVKGDELTKKLEELKTKIEEFQTIQVIPESTGLEYSEDYHPDPNVERTLVDKSYGEDSQKADITGSESGPFGYVLTKEQEEEGAKAVAEMVNAQILAELKALAPEPKLQGEYFFTEKQAKEEVKALSPEPSKDNALDSLSQHDLRHFHRTGQMPK